MTSLTLVDNFSRRRQLRQPRLDVRPLAEHAAATVASGGTSSFLDWRGDGSVRVLVGRIIPAEGPKATIEGRRRRFRLALRELLRDDGWRELRVHVYANDR